MSATRDKTQKVAFVYSNLYQLYRKGKDAATQAEPAPAPATTPAAPSIEGDFARPFSVERDLAASGVVTSKVLKAADVKADKISEELRAAPQIHEYKPAELMAKRLEARQNPTLGLAPKFAARPASLPPRESSNQTLQGLKQNLQALNDLHSRLRFMLQELEELVKE